VGRDVKYFMGQGYKVTAFDASQKMVKLARKETGLPILLDTFETISFQNEFDGVWAQASLLHTPYHSTKNIYQKIYRALKSKGIFYASYKYGEDYMPTKERDFWSMSKETITPYFSDLFEVIEMWDEEDTRSKVSPSKAGKWLNFIVKKITPIRV
jgi:SAM-dependent methyltransferase